MQEHFTEREATVHSLIYGASAAGAYELANVSLGALDNPLAPAALIIGIMGTRYVQKVCESAARPLDETSDSSMIPQNQTLA